MNKKIVLVLSIILVFSLMVFSGEIKRGGTLKVINPWGNLTNNSNPFLPTGQSLPTGPAIYEHLFYMNELTGEIIPELATEFNWINNSRTLNITVRNNVKWNDGVPFTADDIIFTFNYIKKHPELDLNGIWGKSSNISDIEKVNKNSVNINFSIANTPFFYYITLVPIVPEHIWKDIKDPSKFQNQNPVGTGPFIIEKFNAETNIVKLQKNKDYWIKEKPYIDGIEIVAVNSNNTSFLKMLKGEADWTFSFVPDVDRSWVSKSKDNKKWWPTLNTNMLYFNTMKDPFTDKILRKAIAMSINKQQILDKAYYGIGEIADPTGIVPKQMEKWYDKNLDKYSYKYDPQKAKELLIENGYSYDKKNNLLKPDGSQLEPFNILVGAGWTDFITMAQIISNNLKDIGISTNIQQEPWNTYITSVMTGTYDTVICWSTGTGPTPYYLFFKEYSSEFTGKEIGENSVSNYSRYINPIIDEALKSYSTTDDFNVQKNALSFIQKEILKDIPVVPLTSRTEFEIFSEKNFIGWPSDENPYCAGENIDADGGKYILLNIHLK
ncbi:ABC transporter substrate-binding protein [Oceanotoga teriensis]|uniref:ABC transporter substrate-binding protein n=1 Tax=Oceanotoga teriensis TaxID=515440 RepID=UPI0027134C3D|nr:ABC transporter substrate-binding protein [Oceanotoga teriensis]MDO7977393.1 ABC transporter substrate-binding protein [Oceanotoga teriensis]